MTARSKINPFLPALKTMSVRSGPNTTSTPTSIIVSSLPPAASNSGHGYQTVNISVTITPAIQALDSRWIPDAFHRVIGALFEYVIDGEATFEFMIASTY